MYLECDFRGLGALVVIANDLTIADREIRERCTSFHFVENSISDESDQRRAALQPGNNRPLQGQRWIAHSADRFLIDAVTLRFIAETIFFFLMRYVGKKNGLGCIFSVPNSSARA